MPAVSPTISIPTKLLATGVACAVAVVVCGTAATVMVASDVTSRLNTPNRAQLLGGAYRTGSAPGQSFRDRGATAAALDSLVAALGPPVPMAQPVLGTLLALSAEGAKREVSDVTTGAKAPGFLPDVIRRRMAPPFSLEKLESADLANYRRDVLDPSLPAFRQWARGPRQTNLWRYPDRLPDIYQARLLPTPSVVPWRVLFAENEFASLLALHDGQPAMALDRARENVAAARHFAEQPLMLDALFGHLFLRRSLQTLAFVAKSTGDSTTAIRATALDLVAKNYAAMFSVKSLVAQESDAGSHAAEDFAANPAIHPSLRIESLSTITLGGCRSLPELVFGFSAKRRDAMTRAVANIQDIDRGAELGARQQKFLEYVLALREPPEKESPRSILGSSVLLNTFSWIVPPGVRARAALCMEQGF